MSLFGKTEQKPTHEPVVAPGTPPPAPAAKPAATSTIMGVKTRYTGKIDTDEPLLIHGQVDGEIKSSSQVEIGETGVVKATITARSIVISGRVTGDCTAIERLEIKASGKLDGSLKAARIAIAEGAEFKGSSQMTTGSK